VPDEVMDDGSLALNQIELRSELRLDSNQHPRGPITLILRPGGTSIHTYTLVVHTQVWRVPIYRSSWS
jgi:hypothetical protein